MTHSFVEKHLKFIIRLLAFVPSFPANLNYPKHHIKIAAPVVIY